ncbi:MAG: HPr family phosphocarrier protein [Lachnospiraceae bacterium]|nr:HPr family phosphocarrier protein [Candidatus Equihabitans merdae]
MIRTEVTIKLKSGINARPAAMLVQIASQFRSDIHIETDNKRMNAKSIMGMMALGLDEGEVVTIATAGEDEEEAAAAIAGYLTNRE